MADGEMRERGHVVVTADAGRCPACGARTAAGVDWCPRCYAPLTTPAESDEQPPAGAPTPGSAVPAGSAVDETLADDLLADLSAQTPPPLGAWSTRLASTPVRVALMVGGVVLVAGVLVGLMALIGLFLPAGG